MKQMWSDTIVPSLEASLGRELGPLRYHAIKVFGIGESDVEVKLPDLIERTRQPTVGITVSRATITLRIAGRARSQADFDSLIRQTIDEVENALGDLIFGSGNDELEHVVARKLHQRSLTMASVEIGAASWIGDWMLAASDDASARYVASMAFPSLAAASACLLSRSEQQIVSGESRNPDQPPDDVGNARPECDPIWTALAQQARLVSNTDIALAVGTYPTVAQIQQATSPFETVFAIDTDDTQRIVGRRMGGHPDVLGPRIAKTGLDLVRRFLMEG